MVGRSYKHADSDAALFKEFKVHWERKTWEK